MNLSKELFATIVTTLAAGEDTRLPGITMPKLPGEQRQSRRVTAPRGTTLRLIPLTDSIAPGPVDVDLCDVSPGGAKFFFPKRFALEEQFVLILPSQDGQVALLCGVAYWQPLAEDRFAIGAKFTRVLHATAPQPLCPTPVSAMMPIRQAV